MRYCLNATALLAAALLAGCANVVYEGRLSWKDGWREGWVTDVGKGAAIAGKLAEVGHQQRRGDRQTGEHEQQHEGAAGLGGDVLAERPRDLAHRPDSG